MDAKPGVGKTDPPTFKIERETYLKALLPNQRRAELRNGVITVWTRSGEELVFSEPDVRAMQLMYAELRKDPDKS